MKNKAGLIAICLVVAAVVLWFFPLIRIVSVKDRPSEIAEAFDAAKRAQEFWDGELMAALDASPKFTDVIAGLKKDFRAVKAMVDRGNSLSDNCAVMTQLIGKVLSADGKSIVFSVQESDSPLTATASQRMVFGNNVRDACGLLNVNEYASSEDWNALSKELNKLVEARVLPTLQSATMDEKYRLVVCMDVSPECDWSKPVKVVVVSAKRIEEDHNSTR